MSPGPAVLVGALVVRDEDLLMVRTGLGPAGGTWDLPRVAVRDGEMLAEAVVRSVSDCCGYTDALCGPFIGWQEDIRSEGAASDRVHELTMFFHAVLLDGADADPALAITAQEVRWISTYQVSDLRTRDGLVEFLSDQSIIDTVL